eukprot:NODE_5143_length_1060_cov_41.084312_g4587_i0.p1 GENE.NODE_5143_length_1060_cov_41.084312_g4587_i0~~NODE_5143_length_1060_cov_41.084312_g4587_i0.p1  ORF type:complete len:296 (+),score=45.37 NODE_5143_length_1060_cov_41.084312_g4587_i0:33-920(+)
MPLVLLTPTPTIYNIKQTIPLDSGGQDNKALLAVVLSLVSLLIMACVIWIAIWRYNIRKQSSLNTSSNSNNDPNEGFAGVIKMPSPKSTKSAKSLTDLINNPMPVEASEKQPCLMSLGGSSTSVAVKSVKEGSTGVQQRFRGNSRARRDFREEEIDVLALARQVGEIHPDTIDNPLADLTVPYRSINLSHQKLSLPNSNHSSVVPPISPLASMIVNSPSVRTIDSGGSTMNSIVDYHSSQPSPMNTLTPGEQKSGLRLLYLLHNQDSDQSTTAPVGYIEVETNSHCSVMCDNNIF